MDGGPLYLPLIGKDVSAEAERPDGGGGPGGYLSRGPGPRIPSTATGNKYRGMDDGAAVHSKWDGTGCEGMAICPLPVIWNSAPRPPSLLR